jgi:hypothetical protein
VILAEITPEVLGTRRVAPRDTSNVKKPSRSIVSYDPAAFKLLKEGKFNSAGWLK